MTRRAPSSRRAAAVRQRGVIVILAALLLPLVLCAAGVSLELAMLYQRRVRLQNFADAVALAAARSLNGTAAGVDDAAAKAATAAGDQAHSGTTLAWKADALRFSAAPDAPDPDWLDAGQAAADPDAVAYVKVDTRELDVAPAGTAFLALAGGAAPVTAAARAVAGRSSTRVTPLAVCAMGAATGARTNPGDSGNPELLQYGFRFGVSYNLLTLNAATNTETAEYFLVDPLQNGGAGPGGPVDHTDDAVLAPFMCSGTVQLPRLRNAMLKLRRPGTFALDRQLNSRFSLYYPGVVPAALACSPLSAPPDTNVRQYNSAASWMAVAPNNASADPASAAAGHPYNTVADRSVATEAKMYGVLWAYGAARQSSGGSIARSRWPDLYPVSTGQPPAAVSYGLGTPYGQPSGAYFLPPGEPGVAQRRMLVIPLVECPVPSGAAPQARVLALAQFLMMEHAGTAGVRGEFAGVVEESTRAGAVELYR